MSDKPFDPVTEGTPEEWGAHIDAFYDLRYTAEKRELAADIAARDAAKKAEGRREGLEEGRATARYDVLVEIGQVCNAMKNATGAMIKLAIIAQIAKELATGKCRRTAAETAKEGKDGSSV